MTTIGLLLNHLSYPENDRGKILNSSKTVVLCEAKKEVLKQNKQGYVIDYVGMAICRLTVVLH